MVSETPEFLCSLYLGVASIFNNTDLWLCLYGAHNYYIGLKQYKM